MCTIWTNFATIPSPARLVLTGGASGQCQAIRRSVLLSACALLFLFAFAGSSFADAKCAPFAAISQSNVVSATDATGATLPTFQNIVAAKDLSAINLSISVSQLVPGANISQLHMRLPDGTTLTEPVIAGQANFSNFVPSAPVEDLQLIADALPSSIGTLRFVAFGLSPEKIDASATMANSIDVRLALPNNAGRLIVRGLPTNAQFSDINSLYRTVSLDIAPSPGCLVGDLLRGTGFAAAITQDAGGMSVILTPPTGAKLKALGFAATTPAIRIGRQGANVSVALDNPTIAFPDVLGGLQFQGQSPLSFSVDPAGTPTFAAPVQWTQTGGCTTCTVLQSDMTGNFSATGGFNSTIMGVQTHLPSIRISFTPNPTELTFTLGTPALPATFTLPTKLISNALSVDSLQIAIDTNGRLRIVNVGNWVESGACAPNCVSLLPVPGATELRASGDLSGSIAGMTATLRSLDFRFAPNDTSVLSLSTGTAVAPSSVSFPQLFGGTTFKFHDLKVDVSKAGALAVDDFGTWDEQCAAAPCVQLKGDPATRTLTVANARPLNLRLAGINLQSSSLVIAAHDVVNPSDEMLSMSFGDSLTAEAPAWFGSAKFLVGGLQLGVRADGGVQTDAVGTWSETGFFGGAGLSLTGSGNTLVASAGMVHTPLLGLDAELRLLRIELPTPLQPQVVLSLDEQVPSSLTLPILGSATLAVRGLSLAFDPGGQVQVRNAGSWQIDCNTSNKNSNCPSVNASFAPNGDLNVSADVLHGDFLGFDATVNALTLVVPHIVAPGSPLVAINLSNTIPSTLGFPGWLGGESASVVGASLTITSDGKLDVANPGTWTVNCMLPPGSLCAHTKGNTVTLDALNGALFGFKARVPALSFAFGHIPADSNRIVTVSTDATIPTTLALPKEIGGGYDIVSFALQVGIDKTTPGQSALQVDSIGTGYVCPATADYDSLAQVQAACTKMQALPAPAEGFSLDSAAGLNLSFFGDIANATITHLAFKWNHASSDDPILLGLSGSFRSPFLSDQALQLKDFSVGFLRDSQGATRFCIPSTSTNEVDVLRPLTLSLAQPYTLTLDNVKAKFLPTGDNPQDCSPDIMVHVSADLSGSLSTVSVKNARLDGYFMPGFFHGSAKIDFGNASSNTATSRHLKWQFSDEILDVCSAYLPPRQLADSWLDCKGRGIWLRGDAFVGWQIGSGNEVAGFNASDVGIRYMNKLPELTLKPKWFESITRTIGDLFVLYLGCRGLLSSCK